MSDKYWVHKQYNVIFCNEEVETPVGRVCWPHLVAPQELKPGMQGEAKFNITMLIPKEHPKTKTFLDTVRVLVDEMTVLYNERSPAKFSNLDLLTDGDKADPEKYPHHKGNWVLMARNSKPVRVVDGGANPADIEKSMLVGGMKVKALVSPQVHAKGVGYVLKIVQLVKDDGVRFGGGVRDLTKMLSVCEDDDADTGSLAQVKEEHVGDPAGETKVTPIAGAKSAGSAKLKAAVNRL